MIPRPRKAVVRMKPYSPPLENRVGFLRLDFNENTTGPARGVLRKLMSLNSETLACYPRYSQMIKAIARFVGARPENIVPTNGTDEAIKLVIECYCEPSQQVVLLKPSYAMYRFYSELAGAGIIEVPYENDLSFPTEKFLRSISIGTRIVMIANPNNPTGTAVPIHLVPRIASKLRNGLLFIDEAYYEFHGLTAVKLIKKYPNIIISRTFSKAYGMAGLRVGFLVGSSAVITVLRKAHSPYSVNQIAVECVLEAIRCKKDVLRYAREVKKARVVMSKGLGRLGIEYYPSHANFILVRFGNRAKEVLERLGRLGILVRDRNYELPGCLRVGVGTIAQTEFFLKKLEQIWKNS